MAFISAFELRRVAKDRDKQARAARRAQIRRDRMLAKNGLKSGPSRMTTLDKKTLSQKDAATLLDCVIGQWRQDR